MSLRIELADALAVDLGDLLANGPVGQLRVAVVAAHVRSSFAAAHGVCLWEGVVCFGIEESKMRKSKVLLGSIDGEALVAKPGPVSWVGGSG